MKQSILNRLAKLEALHSNSALMPLVFLCDPGEYSEEWAENLSFNHPGRSVFAAPRRYELAADWERAQAATRAAAALTPPQRNNAPPQPPQAARAQETAAQQNEDRIQKQFDDLCRLDKQRQQKNKQWK